MRVLQPSGGCVLNVSSELIDFIYLNDARYIHLILIREFIKGLLGMINFIISAISMCLLCIMYRLSTYIFFFL